MVCDLVRSSLAAFRFVQIECETPDSLMQYGDHCPNVNPTIKAPKGLNVFNDTSWEEMTSVQVFIRLAEQVTSDTVKTGCCV